MNGISDDARKAPLVRLIPGQVKLAQNRIDEALAFLEPLQDESFPLSHLHTILGQAYLRGRLFKNAEAAFRRALSEMTKIRKRTMASALPFAGRAL